MFKSDFKLLFAGLFLIHNSFFMSLPPNPYAHFNYPWPQLPNCKLLLETPVALSKQDVILLP